MTTKTEPLTAEIRRLTAEHSEAVETELISALESTGVSATDICRSPHFAALYSRALRSCIEQPTKVRLFVRLLADLVRHDGVVGDSDLENACMLALEQIDARAAELLVVWSNPKRFLNNSNTRPFTKRIDVAKTILPKLQEDDIAQLTWSLQQAGLVEQFDVFAVPNPERGHFTISTEDRLRLVMSPATTAVGERIAAILSDSQAQTERFTEDDLASPFTRTGAPLNPVGAHG
jgi:hypothetical protein